MKVDEFLNSNDTIGLNDVAFVYSGNSFLKTYEQMPWSHFKNNEIVQIMEI